MQPPSKASDPVMSNPERRRPPLYRPKSRTEVSEVWVGTSTFSILLFLPQGSRSSSRMESRLRGDGGGSSEEDLTRLGVDLRQRLQDEAAAYRRRLDTYRQAQQNQAALVSRLQAKVRKWSVSSVGMWTIIMVKSWGTLHMVTWKSPYSVEMDEVCTLL